MTAAQSESPCFSSDEMVRLSVCLPVVGMMNVTNGLTLTLAFLRRLFSECLLILKSLCRNAMYPFVHMKGSIVRRTA